MLSFTTCPDESGKSRFAGKKLEYWKYCLTIVSLVLVSIQTNAQWTHITDQRTASAGASASVINGKIYVIGGSGEGPGYIQLNVNEVYDPLTNTWDSLAPMPTPRGWLSSGVVDGIIYAIGGGYPTATNKNEAYDPLTNTWDTTKADLLSPIRTSQAGVVDGIIYNIGGSSRDCEAYDPVANSWTSKTPMPGGGGEIAVTVYNGLIYTFGGGSYIVGPYSNVYSYDPQTDTWDTTLTSMPTPRFAFQTYLVGDKIYAIGGSQSQGTSLSTVEVYNPATNTWDTTLPDMPEPLAWFAGAVVNNKIYVIGGTPDWLTGNGWVWVYDPLTDVEHEFTPPTEFALEQNFPNPFNPSTKIKYSIPQTSNVVIKVFDIIGNEIETLVNEEKPAGTYELTWYAENLPSGVYFYQLKAGDYVNTKKMILLK
jgi:hypothetical protein